MFGHNDDDEDKKDEQKTVSPPAEPVADAMLTSGPDDTQVTSDPTGPPPPTDFSMIGAPKADATFLPTTKDETPAKNEPAEPASTSQSNAPSGDLLAIKQQALQKLQPLVSHLDQSPEEKFKTTMMMIQATDDQSMLKEAYEAANSITDEKVRAQALLDVVNEINYFTQHNNAE